VLHGYLERYQERQPLEPAGWDAGLHPGDADWIKQRVDVAIRKGLVRASNEHQHVEYQLAALIGDRLVDARGLPILAAARSKPSQGGEREALAPTHLFEPSGAPLPTGWADLGYLTGFMDGLDLTPENPGVFDHKTAKNRTYAKNPNTLGDDEQMLTYAAVLLAMPGFEDRREVWLRHNIFLKDPEVDPEKAVYSVEVRVDVEHVARHWRWVIDTAKEMKAQRTVPVGQGSARADAYEQVPSALQKLGLVQGKREACECYGGCAYKRACLGYGAIQPVVAELDYEVKRVDQYGNDPTKKPPLPYVEKTFKLTKTAVKTEEKSPASASLKNSTCKVSSSPYPKHSTDTDPNNHPRSSPMPFPPKKPVQTPASNPPQLTVGSYAWVADPDEANKAYRCNILAITGEGAERAAEIYIYADSGAPTPMTAEMRADADRLTTVPFDALSMGLPTGRGGYPYHPATQQMPAGEQIPGTPIPTAGPVSINTPNATEVLAQAADAKTTPAPAAPAPEPKRAPGRPRTTKPAPAKEDNALPEGAVQQTIEGVQPVDPTAGMSALGVHLERAALQGVLQYVETRLKVLEGLP
jgi:hypothetical protein